jgi:hypothetical protein
MPTLPSGSKKGSGSYGPPRLPRVRCLAAIRPTLWTGLDARASASCVDTRRHEKGPFGRPQLTRVEHTEGRCRSPIAATWGGTRGCAGRRASRGHLRDGSEPIGDTRRRGQGLLVALEATQQVALERRSPRSWLPVVALVGTPRARGGASSKLPEAAARTSRAHAGATSPRRIGSSCACGIDGVAGISQRSATRPKRRGRLTAGPLLPATGGGRMLLRDPHNP